MYCAFTLLLLVVNYFRYTSAGSIVLEQDPRLQDPFYRDVYARASGLPLASVNSVVHNVKHKSNGILDIWSDKPFRGQRPVYKPTPPPYTPPPWVRGRPRNPPWDQRFSEPDNYPSAAGADYDEYERPRRPISRGRGRGRRPPKAPVRVKISKPDELIENGEGTRDDEESQKQTEDEKNDSNEGQATTEANKKEGEKELELFPNLDSEDEKADEKPKKETKEKSKESNDEGTKSDKKKLPKSKKDDSEGQKVTEVGSNDDEGIIKLGEIDLADVKASGGGHESLRQTGHITKTNLKPKEKKKKIVEDSGDEDEDKNEEDDSKKKKKNKSDDEDNNEEDSEEDAEKNKKKKKKEKKKKNNKKKKDENDESKENDDENGKLKIVDGEIKVPQSIDGSTEDSDEDFSDEDDDEDDNDEDDNNKPKSKNKKMDPKKKCGMLKTGGPSYMVPPIMGYSQFPPPTNPQSTPAPNNDEKSRSDDYQDFESKDCKDNDEKVHEDDDYSEESDESEKKKRKKKKKKSKKSEKRKKGKSHSSLDYLTPKEKIDQVKRNRGHILDELHAQDDLKKLQKTNSKAMTLGIDCSQTSDEFPLKCGAWQSVGFCETNQATQFLWCRKTCLCTPLATTTPESPSTPTHN
ncbi:unnamed protein product [Caenorhabditis bovis]|uniref:ShKT domain-containing protein n=1 Tax=Caenorhabditis bovis TaxID=2654633 RepID=A0A8S1FDV2_9PELO|nr:unnamed protein product [Caenorhabditis bovis]